MQTIKSLPLVFCFLITLPLLAAMTEACTFITDSKAVRFATFSPCGKKIATAGADNTVRIWDAETGEELRKMEGGQSITSIAFLPDGQNIIMIGFRGTSIIWDIESEKEVQTLRHGGGMRSLSPDRRKIASANRDGVARIVDVESGEVVSKFERHTDELRSVSFSPDGKKIEQAAETELLGYGIPRRERN